MKDIAIELTAPAKNDGGIVKTLLTPDDGFKGLIYDTLNNESGPDYHFFENLTRRDDKYQEIIKRLNKDTTPEEIDEITEELNDELFDYIAKLNAEFNTADATGKVNLIKDYLEDSGKDNKWYEITVLHPVEELKNYIIPEENKEELEHYVWDNEWVDLEGALDDGVIEEK